MCTGALAFTHVGAGLTPTLYPSHHDNKIIKQCTCANLPSEIATYALGKYEIGRKLASGVSQLAHSHPGNHSHVPPLHNYSPLPPLYHIGIHIHWTPEKSRMHHLHNHVHTPLHYRTVLSCSLYY